MPESCQETVVLKATSTLLGEDLATLNLKFYTHMYMPLLNKTLESGK